MPFTAVKLLMMSSVLVAGSIKAASLKSPCTKASDRAKRARALAPESLYSKKKSEKKEGV